MALTSRTGTATTPVMLPSLLLLLVAAVLPTTTQAAKDNDYYFPNFVNPNTQYKMYWKDSINVLQDLDQFDALYIRYHHCVWSKYGTRYGTGEDYEEDDADENDSVDNGCGGFGGEYYWYMGRTQCFKANAAYSLYGVLKGENPKMKGGSFCHKESFINSFHTTFGAESFAGPLGLGVDTANSYCTTNGYQDGDNNEGDDAAYAEAQVDDDYLGDDYVFYNYADDFTSQGTGCSADGAFVIDNYNGAFCNGQEYNSTINTLDDFNAALYDMECQQIFDSSNYNNDQHRQLKLALGEDQDIADSDKKERGLEQEDYDFENMAAYQILSFSKSCSLTQSPHDCPDPYGRKRLYAKNINKALTYKTGSRRDMGTKAMNITAWIALVTAIGLLAGAYWVYDETEQLELKKRRRRRMFPELMAKVGSKNDDDDGDADGKIRGMDSYDTDDGSSKAGSNNSKSSKNSKRGRGRRKRSKSPRRFVPKIFSSFPGFRSKRDNPAISTDDLEEDASVETPYQNHQQDYDAAPAGLAAAGLAVAGAAAVGTVAARSLNSKDSADKDDPEGDYEMASISSESSSDNAMKQYFTTTVHDQPKAAPAVAGAAVVGAAATTAAVSQKKKQPKAPKFRTMPPVNVSVTTQDAATPAKKKDSPGRKFMAALKAPLSPRSQKKQQQARGAAPKATGMTVPAPAASPAPAPTPVSAPAARSSASAAAAAVATGVAATAAAAAIATVPKTKDPIESPEDVLPNSFIQEKSIDDHFLDTSGERGKEVVHSKAAPVTGSSIAPAVYSTSDEELIVPVLLPSRQTRERTNDTMTDDELPSLINSVENDTLFIDEINQAPSTVSTHKNSVITSYDTLVETTLDKDISPPVIPDESPAEVFVDEAPAPLEKEVPVKPKKNSFFNSRMSSKGKQGDQSNALPSEEVKQEKSKKRGIFSNTLAPALLATAAGAQMASSKSKNSSQNLQQQKGEKGRQGLFKKSAKKKEEKQKKSSKKTKAVAPPAIPPQEEVEEAAEEPQMNLTDIITILEPTPPSSQESLMSGDQDKRYY